MEPVGVKVVKWRRVVTEIRTRVTVIEEWYIVKEERLTTLATVQIDNLEDGRQALDDVKVRYKIEMIT